MRRTRPANQHIQLRPHDLWYTNTHTHPFNGPLSRITRVSWCQKGKTNLDFTEARDSEWQWHQLGYVQVCTSLRQITIPAPHHSVFYRPDALPAAQKNSIKAPKALWYTKSRENVWRASAKCQHDAKCTKRLFQASTQNAFVRVRHSASSAQGGLDDNGPHKSTRSFAQWHLTTAVNDVTH